MDNLITQCANEMWSHWNNTNMSFQQRIQESTDAHNKLQSHLSKTMQEIYDQEKHVEALKQAIRMKGNPLKVAQTRLEARCHRPDVELCRDPPHHRLVEEVSLVQIMLLCQLSYAIKKQLYDSLWYRWLPCTEKIYYRRLLKFIKMYFHK